MPNLIGVGMAIILIAGMASYIAHDAGMKAGLAQGGALARANCATEKAEAKTPPVPPR